MATKKRMPISKFKTLHVKGLGGRMQQATMTAQRFGVPRNLLLAATSESMIEAWRKGKPDVLERRDGSKLLDGTKGNGCAELRELLKALQTWLVAPALDNRTLAMWQARIKKALSK